MKSWTTDRIIGATSIIVSICTLILFLYEINLVRKQQYAAVLPYLSILNMGAGGDQYQLLISNDGLGPAFITSVKVVHNGKEFAVDPIGYFKQASNRPKDSLNLVYTNVQNGSIVAVGKPIALLQCLDRATSEFVLKNLFNDSSYVEVEYKSVYEEKWKISSNSMTPVKLN